MHHLVKIGLFGSLGCFRAVDGRAYPRDAEVICRTPRGLEIGHVVCPLDDFAPDTDGELLRGMGDEDYLIVNRLERFRERAYQACVEKLKEREVTATLLDVEHLFDGESVYFYFLGDVTPEMEAVTGELADAYERKVRFRKFAETLAQGCGPGCGESAAGCSTGGCAGCGVAGQCGSAAMKKKAAIGEAPGGD